MAIGKLLEVSENHSYQIFKTLVDVTKISMLIRQTKGDG